MRPWAPWVDERWVGLLVADSSAWLRASWKARCLFSLLARVVGRGDGRVVLDGDVQGEGVHHLKARLFADEEDIRPPLDELATLGLVRITGCSIEIVGWLDGADLPSGGYVRLYTRDTAAWINLSVWARGVLCLLLRCASRDGVHFLGSAGAAGLARLLRAPLAELQPILDELLGPAGEDMLEHDAQAREIRILSYREAQEANTTDAARKRAERERARSLGKNPASSTTSSHGRSQAVTESHSTSRPVTSGHGKSQHVTAGHSDLNLSDPSLSERSLPETTTSRPDRSSRAVVVGASEQVNSSDDASSPPTAPSGAASVLAAPTPTAHVRPRPAFGWASPEEQRAGEAVLACIERAGAKPGDHRGPLAIVATPQIARSLLEFTVPEVCGHMGRLELADVLFGIDAIGQSEATRMLGPGELPKTPGALSSYLHGGVKNRKRGDARRAASAQAAPAQALSPEHLQLAREAVQWAWRKVDESAPARIIDDADNEPLAQIWGIAEREAGANTKWQNFSPNEIQRIIAHWLLKYFRSTDKAVVEKGYPLTWLLSSDASRIKSYGLPDRRSAPKVKPALERQRETDAAEAPVARRVLVVNKPTADELAEARARSELALAAIEGSPVADLGRRPKM